MRKITLLIASLFIVIGAMAQVDYKPTNVNVGNKTNTDRPMTSVKLGENTYTLSANEQGSCYVDKYDGLTFEVVSGQTYALEINTTGFWIHGYVYVDYGSDGFTAGVTGNYKPTGDLVAYSFYNNGGSNDNSGWNSNGATISGDNRNRPAIPSWTVPAGLAPGEYRIRFKLDWCNIDPQGDADGNFGDFMANGGQILDAKLVVKAISKYNVTYNFKEGEELVASVTHEVLEGSEYPNLPSGLYQVTVNESKPSGTVTENGEFDFTVTVGELPFEYAKTYDAIGNKWYNLIMHSNWNTGNAAAKYRTYVGAGADNATTLEWGTKRSLSNATDDYYWAFVGDPINGFRVVNKAKGEDFVLSSNGTENPLLKEESTLQDGYNTTWQLAARKYNVGQTGDHIQEGAWFCLKHTNGKYINANAGNGNVAFWSDNDNGSAILAVKPITINPAADYSTYYSDNYIIIPQTVAEVYYVNSIESSCAKLEQIEGDSICMQNGVIIKKEVDATFTYAPEITAKGTIASIEGNPLKGTTKRTLFVKENNKAYYALGLVEGVVGFYNAVNGDNENEFYNGAFKAYLELPTSQSTAAFYGFNFDETTGVEEVEVENAVKTIYDLSGRKVSNMSTPGLYIVNGKKVLVK